MSPSTGSSVWDRRNTCPVLTCVTFRVGLESMPLPSDETPPLTRLPAPSMEPIRHGQPRLRDTTVRGPSGTGWRYGQVVDKRLNFLLPTRLVDSLL